MTNFGPNTRYQDNEDDTFTDVSTRASLANKQWRTSCAVADIDTMLNIISSRSGMWKRGIWVYCGPCSYPPDADVRYRNNGDGTFTDLSSQSGIFDIAAGHELGVTFGDYGNDGGQDLYIANDRDPNFLFRNRGDGVFEEVALMLAVACHDDMGDERSWHGNRSWWLQQRRFAPDRKQLSELNKHPLW